MFSIALVCLGFTDLLTFIFEAFFKKWMTSLSPEAHPLQIYVKLLTLFNTIQTQLSQMERCCIIAKSEGVHVMEFVGTAALPQREEYCVTSCCPFLVAFLI